jgi:cell division protein FtsQ
MDRWDADIGNAEMRIQLFKRKKPRKNIRKGAKVRRRIKIFGPILLGFKLTTAIAGVAVVTGFFILVHDLLTQSEYFAADELTIGGTRRLTKEQVIRQARVARGDNILAVNLSLVRKRLLAQPWIAEAEVGREIPSGLRIRIVEHSPLAVVEVGQKFLINRQGVVFKAWEAGDPVDLPVITGLDASDLTVFEQPGSAADKSRPVETAPFEAVMQVLKLGLEQESILPNGQIKRISVDRQTGITIYAFDRIKAIYLGYSDYAGKYHMLSNLFSYFKRQRSIVDFDRIDLNNLQRVVVNPVKIGSPPEGS